MSPGDVKTRESSANIFINYRREDSSGHAGRLFDGLSVHFAGRLFMDIDNLEPGVDFVDAITQAVGSCEVLIVIIGREWLTIEDKAGRRRLDNPDDFVRLEVESALERKIRVIPVLVQDAPMPRAEEMPASLARLARRNAIELSDARWAYDVDRLAQTIQEILKEKSAPAPTATPLPLSVAPVEAPQATKPRVWQLSLAALVLVAAIALASWAWMRPSGNGDPLQTEPASPIAEVPLPGPAPVPAPIEPTPAPVTVVKDPGISNSVHKLKVSPLSISVPKNEPPAPSIVAEVETEAAVPAPSVQPARATILSPRNGETVGSDVMVEGVVTELGKQQIFMGIRQGNGSIYPRGELFVDDGKGHWAIKLKSSKEKTFDILVVTSTNQDASQMLRDQRSRDNGLAILPPGASISSGIVTLKKQGRIGSILNPKRPGSGR